ncbi:MAG: hypothetical protein AAF152_00930 [Cyanobacteria bacterium P01_A01_bin.114]
MSDTTTFIAGCATTGVAVLVLLVARVGDAPAERPTDRVEFPPEQPVAAPVVPVPQVPDSDNNEELRNDLERQREITSRLETQLAQQEMIARNLENQLQQQQTETRQVLTQLENYQRSLDTLSLQNSQLAESSHQPSGNQSTLLWLGGGLFVVLILGGGGLMFCMVLLTAQSQKRQERSMQMMYHPIQVPTPPSYRYYEQEFLPPLPTRPRRATPYNPPPHYDYEG